MAEKWAKTRRETAEFFDVTTRAIGLWLRAGAPGRTRRGYCLDGIVCWRLRRAEELVAERTDPLRVQLLGQQIRKLEIRNNQSEEQLVDVASCHEAWAIGFGRILDRLESVPNELLAILPEDLRPCLERDVISWFARLGVEIGSWGPDGRGLL